ncbi:hypothetical protein BTN49_3199 [Candidatus Enterovibrio escicola]|uniref:Uncharacterized protein n=1 Tax=Candidatus Enterovibrio escicola TaxID=1927127 RepID=A0A2A5SZF9_9GAMM|nr:hypothetical protein BTN49_3199 [Candidatus Enterovibrio escacola]
MNAILYEDMLVYKGDIDIRFSADVWEFNQDSIPFKNPVNLHFSL